MDPSYGRMAHMCGEDRRHDGYQCGGRRRVKKRIKGGRTAVTTDAAGGLRACGRWTDREGANLAQIAYIYGLPKIHKPDVPLRPIISYHLSPAYTLSKFLSNFLTPLLQSPPWEYTIANSPSFVSYITSLTPPPRSIMVSFDVTSLYLSLAHPLIINSLRTFLENAPLLDTLTAETVVELTSICLGMSTFTFDTQFFKQTKGSPMGSPLSTVVAEVVMRSLDQWITSRHSSDIFLWRRYIDDTFCLVSEVSASHILSDLNSFHPDIAFTHETENHSVQPFLDTLVIRTPSSFHTTVYYKNNTPPHHTNFRSHCPTPHKINTVRALTKRIFTHCSLPLFQTIEKAKIFSYLSKSGYPTPFILKHMHDPHHNSAPAIHRNICSLPFCPQSITIARFLRQHGITTYFQNPPNIATLIRHPITRSSLHASSLRSGGAVYSVSCDQCNATYVGETGRSVAIRMAVHGIETSKRKVKYEVDTQTPAKKTPKISILDHFSSVPIDRSTDVVLARMIALDGLSFSVFVTSKDLRKCLNALGHEILLSAETIKIKVCRYA
ncbi:hypothetical protein LAZ67_13000605 [Cordylochernes scorpioides]|uniref:Reverse transcriptase domain-containing protein n=1 Tax=Cordylochernes scorpioides TaxID=51811 RepID=A0ABY6L3X5_9ARAC|nr:hypothetical protein LAZ67_13000605 [Cordylochernes scorpioides]